MASRFFGEIRASLSNALEFLDMPGVREGLSETNFPTDMLRGHSAPVTIYVVLERQNIGIYARYLRLVYQTLVDLVAQQRGRRVAVIVDEFPALRRFDRVIQDLAMLRGFGVQFHLAVQDLNQLNEIYGHGWQSIVGNCAARQFLGVNDHFTADYVEKLLGQTTIERPYAHHVQPWGGEGPGFWKSDFVGRPLMTAAEIANLPRSEQIIFLDGCPRPIRMFKLNYFNVEPWASRANEARKERA